MDSTRCGDCHKEFDLRTNQNGSFLYPATKCPHCGTVSLFGEIGRHWDNIIKSGRVGKIDEGITFKTLREGTPAQQIEELRVLEYWVQLYVKENNLKLGFSSLKGPFDRGPDFLVTYKGRETYAEAEIRCDNYLKHGHPNDPRFNSDVEILIVLEPEDPSPEIKDQLPPTVIHLNTQDFERWYSQATQEYAVQKEKEQPTKKAEAKLRLLAWEFQRRFYAFFPEINKEAETEDHIEVWEEVALEFLADRNTVELTLGDISQDELDQFSSRIIAARGPRGLASVIG